MTPAAIDRVFGRGRLRMVTGDHCEVFREESQPGERRRYTKRFLATPAGDFREWTEREWRILARLVGHGIGPVPDVVQFDRGAGGRQALVQTYDAGVTIDHWTTLLPVRRDGETRAHVFEDCAHWWALARHSLIALDAIHELHLVHLDLKADNVCIPVGPADFDPEAPDACLHPEFERIALIDFAFSLVSGERLDSALPIARQTEYDYQSPRLLAALEEGRRGNLWPTRQLDWRCDLFSLAAMLRRSLPEPGLADANGWTASRQAGARALVRRLLEAHDAELPATRPHGALIALAEDGLRDPDLIESLQRGWQLGERANPANDDSPTPITRIALPVSPLRIATDVISLDSSDVDGWASANPAPPPRVRPRRGAWIVGLTAAAAAAASVPLLGEAWRTWGPPSGAPRTAAAASAVPAPQPRAVAAKVEPKSERVVTPPASLAAIRAAEPPTPRVAEQSATRPAEPPVARAAEPPVARAVEPPVARAAESPAARAAEPPAARAAETPTRRTSPPPSHRVAAVAPAPAQRAAAAGARAVPVEVRPAAFPVMAKASTRPTVRSPIYLPPAVGLAPLPSSAASPSLAASPSPSRLAASAAAPAVAVATPSLPQAEEVAIAAPPDFMLRANDLLATQIPRVAQRAERMVLRVLVAAANADEAGRDDDEVRLAAGAIRLAPDDPQLARVASREARQFHESARIALRRGDFAEALGLQTRAFGANPVDAEIVGSLAWMRLKQGPAQAEAARRLALHALTLHDWKYPSGRIEDWNTFAIASALTGHERDARNAWLVALALAGGSERQCRAAIDAYAQYGEALRTPVEAMLYRANATARPQRSRLCEWPPHWAASTR
ncbi:MAG: hypothetical protein K8R60_17680 [Burkholderiales bacterium]|nr:hypothetical protein [Burkholderiales bacterium]